MKQGNPVNPPPFSRTGTAGRAARGWGLMAVVLAAGLGASLAAAPGRAGGAEATGAGRVEAGRGEGGGFAPARAVIEIWLWGGPSHLDTFDPKPEAGPDYTGPLAETVATNVPGIELNAMLPKLARQADKYALIRSMTHGINAHETAAYIMQTGRTSGGGTVFPSIGAVVAKMKGGESASGVLPPYIALTSQRGRFAEEGFLGPAYKPFATGGDPAKQPFVVEGIVAEGLSDTRQEARRNLLHRIDTLGLALPGLEVFQEHNRCEEAAYDLVFGPAREIFDLTREPAEVRDRYGRNTFGQSCLTARRLVEAGVLYVSINSKGWDTHKGHFQDMRQRLPQLDQGLAALLEDLAARGLLDSTVVWCTGEFGRSPRVLWEEPWNGGRNHFGACFSALVAGGGFTGGAVVGASDARGEKVAERPVSPQDLLGSIYELLGIDPDGPMPNPVGLDVPVLPPGNGAGAGRLREIMPPPRKG